MMTLVGGSGCSRCRPASVMPMVPELGPGRVDCELSQRVRFGQHVAPDEKIFATKEATGGQSSVLALMVVRGRGGGPSCG